jgi:hypothetical protein
MKVCPTLESAILIALLVLALFSKSSLSQDASNKPVVKIVAYDRIRGFLNWLQEWFVEAARKDCPTTTCIITEDKKQVGSADMILFHAPTHSMVPNMKMQEGAIRTFISMEQPKYAKFLQRTDYLEKNFELISTYSMRTHYPGTKVPNLPITYFPLNILSADSVLQPVRSFADKNGYGTGVSVAAFVSNCKAAGATERTAYLEELMKHIKIHQYGKCLKNREEPDFPKDPKWPPIAQRRARKVKLLSEYKFYLAFENYQVEDYVSEKIFEGLFSGAVPVYRGDANVGRFMPSNDSFIDANKLSPKELADKLNGLAGDEKAYNKYFEFKEKALPQHFEEVALMSYTHPNVLCRMCHYALENGPRG